jgi:predicted lipoprotein
VTSIPVVSGSLTAKRKLFIDRCNTPSVSGRFLTSGPGRTSDAAPLPVRQLKEHVMQRTHRSRTRARIVGAVALVVLVVAMALNTKFLTPAEVAAIAPKPFEPAQTADELFARAQDELPDRAQPLGEVLPALQADLPGAASKYEAVSPSEGAYVFPVTATGTVEEATDASLRLAVPGVPSQTPVIVPLSTAVNGTPIRDVMGFKFADAPGQTDYQYVGDELKKLMLAGLDSSVGDPGSLKGKKVTVLGAVSIQGSGTTVPKAKPVNVQPVRVEVGS